MCCLPLISAPTLSYDNLFRIIVMQFIDAYNFDVRAIKSHQPDYPVDLCRCTRRS